MYMYIYKTSTSVYLLHTASFTKDPAKANAKAIFLFECCRSNSAPTKRAKLCKCCVVL